MQRNDLEYEYAGFWVRTWALILDAILECIATYPILIWIYGWEYFDPEITGFIAGPADFLIMWVLPTVVIIAFWIKMQATPGKMAMAARIVDAKTGKNASTAQYVLRYFAYILSALPLGLGFFWVIFDKRKQGWHDKLARTVVVHRKKQGQRSYNPQRPKLASSV